MSKMQREKGKRGEREAADQLRKLGIDARRGVQFSGGVGSPDVVTALGNVHIEVKRTEALRLYPSLDQASNDSGDKLPLVLHRKNGKRWVAIMYLDDLVDVAVDVVATITAEVDRDYDKLVGLIAVQTAEIARLNHDANSK